MFTVALIEKAHEKVKSGAEFPNYIKEIKQLGVIIFETWVSDSHTIYFGKNDYQQQSKPMYNVLTIAEESDKETFENYLKSHQKGKTDYYTFCKHCAETGIEKWVADLDKMTCTYFDTHGNSMLEEQIPG